MDKLGVSSTNELNCGALDANIDEDESSSEDDNHSSKENKYAKSVFKEAWRKKQKNFGKLMRKDERKSMTLLRIF